MAHLLSEFRSLFLVLKLHYLVSIIVPLKPQRGGEAKCFYLISMSFLLTICYISSLWSCLWFYCVTRRPCNLLLCPLIPRQPFLFDKPICNRHIGLCGLNPGGWHPSDCPAWSKMTGTDLTQNQIEETSQPRLNKCHTRNDVITRMGSVEERVKKVFSL